MARVRHSVGVEFTGDGSNLQQAVVRSERVIDDYANAVDRASRKSRAAAQRQREFGRASRELQGYIRGTVLSLGSLVGAYGAWQTLNVADDYKRMAAMLQLATERTGDYNEVSRRLYQLSQDNGVALRDTVDLYSRIARAAGDMGKSSDELVKFTDIVQKLGIATGASAEEMQRALLQMSQSMAGGIVRAEEFNSVIENTPGIAKAMAEGLGVSMGELRNRMLDGKLSAEDMFDAILSQGAKADEMFDKMPLTLERATNSLQNSFGTIVSKIDATFGVTESLSGAIKDLSDYLDELDGDDLRDLADAAEIAGTAFGTMMVAGRLVPIISGIGAAATGAAGGVSLLANALKFLGGPIGLAITAAATLAVAYSDLTEKVERLRKEASIKEFTRPDASVEELRRSLAAVEGVMAKLAETSGKTTAAYKQQKQNAEVLRKQIDALTSAAKKQTSQTGKSTKAVEQQKKSADALKKTYSELLKTYDKEAAKLRKTESEKKQLQRLLKAEVIDQKEYNRLLGLINRSTAKVTTATRKKGQADANAKREAEKHRREVEQQRRAYQSLIHELYPLEKEFDDYTNKLNILSRELNAGRITTEQFEDAVFQLDKKMLGFDESLEKTGKSAKKVRDEADPFAKLWENAIDRVDSSFASLFRNMLDGGLDSFKDFGRAVSDLAKDIVAELAYTFTKQKLFGQGGLAAGLFGLDAGSMTGGVAGMPGMAGVFGGMDPSTAGALSALGMYGLYGAGGMAFAQGGNKVSAGVGGVIGGSAGMIFGGPAGAAVGSAVGGAVFAPIGAKWGKEGSGVKLGVSGGGISGVNYQDYKKKGWTGNRWKQDITALDAELQTSLDSLFGSYKTAAQELAEAFNHNSSEIQRAINEFTVAQEEMQLSGLSQEEIQAKLQQWVNDTGAKLLEAVVPEMSGVIEQAGDRAGELMQPLLDIANYLSEDWQPQYQQSLQKMLDLNELSIKRQLLEYDGSVEDTKKMAATLRERATIEQQMLTLIANVSKNLNSLFGATIETLKTDMMTKKEIFDRDWKRMQELRKKLETATDPEEIDRLSRELNATINKLWNEAKSNMAAIAEDAGKYQGEQLATYLSEQKKALNEKLQAYARESNEAAQRKLEAMKDKVEATHDDMADRFKKIMVAVGDDQKLAAARLQESARQLNESARVMNQQFGGAINRMENAFKGWLSRWRSSNATFEP